MFGNYFRIAFRNIRGNKIFSLINISGLAIGISAALVIYLIVQYEFRYNHFGKGTENLYRVVSIMHFPNQEFKNSGVPGPLTKLAQNEIPGITASAAFWDGFNGASITLPGNNGKERVIRNQEKIVFADGNYFNLFPYTWLYGNPATALNAPGQVVLTENRAKDYFGNIPYDNIIGRIITYKDTIHATVTGIVKDLPKPTDFVFQEFLSAATFKSIGLEERNYTDEWGSINSASQFFVKLQPGTDIQQLNKKLSALREKYKKPNDGLKSDYYLQPLNDVHFNSDFDAFSQRQAHKPTLYGLLAVAAFLLLLGGINFVNLTTAQAVQRAKEIGIRKTLGGSRAQLVVQFLAETFVLTLMATILSLLLTPLILQIFADFIPEGLTFSLTANPQLWLFTGLLLVSVSVISGFYPALVLSRYKPVQVLKGQAVATGSTTRKALLRKSLTVTQFAIAQFFIIATFIVSQQIRFSMNKDLGFSKDAIVNFSVPVNYDEPDHKQYVLLEKLHAIPGISNVSLGGAPPASNDINFSTMQVKDVHGKETNITVQIKNADSAYLELYSIKLLAGRNLHNSDTIREYLINESYARFLGCKKPEDALKLFVDRGTWEAPVVGVVADFHSKSMREAIAPLALTSTGNFHNVFHVALQPRGNDADNWKNTLKRIETAWKEIYPAGDFSYKFLDERIASFYKTEQQTVRLLTWASGLAVVISCLGLLGLVIYTTNQRVKEIGVRKVLGATVTQLVTLLSKDFVKLVLLAFVIAIPLAWWAMHQWLQGFAYRAAISWWIFALCGSIMLLIAILVMAFKVIRSAMDNPVKSLRSE